jgi:uncharacterized protein YciI
MSDRERVPSERVKSEVGESLGLQLYAAISTAVSLHAVKERLAAHRAYLRELEDSDRLFAAGPLWTEDGRHFEGDGLLVYRAASVEEARRIADADPLHAGGARTYRLMPWLLNDGALTMRVVLSRRDREVR